MVTINFEMSDRFTRVRDSFVVQDWEENHTVLELEKGLEDSGFKKSHEKDDGWTTVWKRGGTIAEIGVIWT